MGKYFVKAGEQAGAIKRVEPARDTDASRKVAGALNQIFDQQQGRAGAPQAGAQQSDQRSPRRTLGRSTQSQARPVRRATLLGET